MCAADDVVRSSTRRPGPAAWLLIAPIRFYQRLITPYTPASCRYYPTCSAYAVTALREHGALRGSWLTIRRLGRCNPWSSGGVDHVPASRRTIRERRSEAGSSVTGSSSSGSSDLVSFVPVSFKQTASTQADEPAAWPATDQHVGADRTRQESTAA